MPYDFLYSKMGLILADSCFKSQEIDFGNQFADLSGYFSIQNTPIEYWAMFEKGKKGCLEEIVISELKQ